MICASKQTLEREKGCVCEPVKGGWGERYLWRNTILFNKILKTWKLPNEWRNMVLVPIHNNERDIRDSTKYKGTKAHESYYEALEKSY